MVTQSRSQPGILKEALGGLATGAAQSLGRQSAEAIGGLIGAGAQKLGKAVGVGGPSKDAIQFWVSQGFSPEEAAQIAQQPPQIQQQLLKQKASGKRAEAIGTALGGITGQSRQPAAEGIQAQETGAPEEYDLDLVEAARNGATEQDIFNLLKAKQGQEKIGQQQEKIGLLHKKEERAGRKEEREEYKLIKPALEKWTRSEADAQEDEHMMDEVEALFKSGKVQGPATFGALKGVAELPVIGHLLGGLAASKITPETQLADKWLSSQVKNFGTTFKGNFTNKELDALKATIPTLMNTQPGIKLLFKAKRMEDKIKKLPKTIFDELKAKYKGKLPLDIEDQVNRKVAKETGRLRGKIRESFELPETNPELGKESQGGQYKRDKLTGKVYDISTGQEVRI